MSYSDVAPVARPRIRSGYCRAVFLRLLPGLAGAVALLVVPALCGAELGDGDIIGFTNKHCTTCHNDVDREGGLDLTTFKYAPGDSGNFLTWVKVHDRVLSGEMPAKEIDRPNPTESVAFIKVLVARVSS